MIPLRSIALAVLPLLSSTLSPAAPPGAQTAAQIRFTYENPKLEPHKYVLVVGEDGSGKYHSEGSGSSADGQSMASEPLGRPIHVSKAVRDSIFAAARKTSSLPKAVMMGERTLLFRGPKRWSTKAPMAREVASTTGARTDRLVSLQTSLRR